MQQSTHDVLAAQQPLLRTQRPVGGFSHKHHTKQSF
jgi:hypothetical protein